MNLTQFIGNLTIMYFMYRTVTFLWTLFRCYMLKDMFGYGTDLRQYGEWVIVTGATDGIGKEYARQFAQQGFNILLISRNAEKLQHVQKGIATEFNVSVRTIVFDFDKTDCYDEIETATKQLDVGILVNNVGRGTAGEETFVNTRIDEIDNVLRCNMFSAVHMTHMVMKHMLQRQRGLIIHVSSLVVAMDLPFPIYSSTKMFLHKFHRSLQLENPGIEHQLVTPCFVATKKSNRTPSLFVPRTEDYVRSAIGTIGVVDVTCGYWVHDLQEVVCGWLPKQFWEMIASKKRKES